MNVEFFLYFNKKIDSAQCRAELEYKGYKTSGYHLLKSPVKKQWCLRVTRELAGIPALDRTQWELDWEAQKFSGSYDGYEHAVEL